VRTLHDFWACALAGAPDAPSWPAGGAGRLAVAAAHVDLDDLHLGSLTHPGGVVWSAVAACAGECGTSFRDALEAAALGYELTVRLACAYSPEHRARWHATATAGTVGAAGAAALLLGGASAVADAVGHALSVAGGSVQAMVERSGSRTLHRAHAADAGVACARAAAAGLAASRLNLEGGRGDFAPPPEDVADALERTGARSAIEETGVRLHAATGFAHTAIDAALGLGRIDPETIAAVRIAVEPAAGALAAAGDPRDDEAAWWSIPHAVATCLATGAAPAYPGGLSADPAVRALCRRCTVAAAGSGWSARVAVELRDGAVRESSADGPWGHGARAATDADRAAKWHLLAGGDGARALARLEAAAGEPFAAVAGELAGPAAALVA
jgi:2-methylcitrate dehydratase PrpD